MDNSNNTQLTEREIHILRNLVRNEYDAKGCYIDNLRILYKQELHEETITTYQDYISELSKIKRKLIQMQDKLEGGKQ